MRLELTRRGDYGVRAMVALARGSAVEGGAGTMPAVDPGWLSVARIAAEMAIPERFLPQVMRVLARAGLVRARTGRSGGYRLARPPAEVSVLDVVLAVEGEETAFRCSEIRQRGPAAGGPELYRRPCGIARAMWRAEDAWRAELAATSIGDLVVELMATVPRSQLVKGAEWVQSVEINRRSRR
jgi:Rrf2 family protein